VIEVALSAARFLGRSRKVSIFAGVVAVAGLVHELQQRRERGSEAAAEG
jgi:hypothetical protein